MQQQNIQAQAQANAQAQQVASQAEIQKQQAVTQMNTQLEQVKSNMKIQELQQEALVKKDLMQFEFDLNMKLKGVESEAAKETEARKEDRKDERTRIQASQQSELIDQRAKGKSPKRFESSGNDVIGQGIGLDNFNPR